MGPLAVLLLGCRPCFCSGIAGFIWFWHLPGLVGRSLFQVFSEIVFTKRRIFSAEHPVSVLFGQMVLLLGKATTFVIVPGGLI